MTGYVTQAIPFHQLQPGFRLDRYELLCILGQGGMGHVWLARIEGKHGFKKLVAVKTISRVDEDGGSFKRMFLDEARIAARIEHPNVIQILDVGECMGIPYLVMDLAEGEPLQRLIRDCTKQGTPIPLGIALRVLADACLGLHAAHELRDDEGIPLGVVHRDVSPENIMVTASGISKLIDFGIAKARDRSSDDTAAGVIKGKIQFMPREQVLCEELDRRADTWALGAVLYYVLSGRPPYKKDSQMETLHLAMSAAPIPPLPDQVPLVLRELTERALSHDKEKRYQTALEMGRALEQAMRAFGVVTHSEVGAFAQERMAPRFEARKELVQRALSQATMRESARESLTQRESDGQESGDSLMGPAVDLPTAVEGRRAISQFPKTLVDEPPREEARKRAWRTPVLVGVAAVAVAALIGIAARRGNEPLATSRSIAPSATPPPLLVPSITPSRQETLPSVSALPSPSTIPSAKASNAPLVTPSASGKPPGTEAKGHSLDDQPGF